MFEEHHQEKGKFKFDDKFMVVLLSTAIEEDDMLANIGFIPSIAKFHKVVLVRPGQKPAPSFAAAQELTRIVRPQVQ
jgi:hypothetical protein